MNIMKEIFNIKKIKFLNKKSIGHYEKTPYSYIPKKGINLKDELEYDIGQGLLELYDYIKNENQNE